MATPTDKVKDAIEEGANKTDKAIATMAGKASHATRRAQVAAEDAVDGGRDALEGALICGKAMIRANPLAAVATVAVVAYLWGRLRR
ncbi:hypothetical protein RE432_16170 [Pusillimonas sp. SM2304]|uniref:hypothetical protein n=1 Tax=Pusillimonas sp. SM2304 TaxID=3073241 RepID=UPI002876DBDD|nr:hypothetical protein [Pusillimonas sp. SM2304]MDS1141980.1 hypothetical protein [Pusillimonas sp. SM2304]